MPGAVHVGVGVAVWISADGASAGELPCADDLLLVGIRKGSHGAGLLALPGGWLEWGEGLAQTGARELAEETGICCACRSQTPAQVAASACLGTDGKQHPDAILVDAPLRELATPAWGNLFGPDGETTSAEFGGRPRDEVALHTVTTYVGVRLPEAVEAVHMEPHKTEGWAWLRIRDLVPSARSSLHLAEEDAGTAGKRTEAAASSSGVVSTPLFPAAAGFVLQCVGIRH
jgi:8-oxo-dGTP pyrophosphatase MutT (NUDIX family)